MTMVERVARRIYGELTLWYRPTEAKPEWDQLSEGNKWIGRRLALTAIEAMRGPTEDMVEIAGDVEGYADQDRIFEHAWNAMIDGALFEEKAAAKTR